MKIFSPDDSEAMADAEFDIYDCYSPPLEQEVFACADETVTGYDGGTWAFHSNGTVGYWVPQGEAAYSVACAGNYFEHPAMDAESLGVALTLLAINRQIWWLHSEGRDFDKLARAQEKLRDFAYADDSTLNTNAIYGFLD